MRQVTLDELARVAANSREDLWAAAKSAGHDNPLIVLHWSAGWYEDNSYDDDYHIQIGEHGEIYLSTEDLSEVLAHTWHMNTGTVGVSMCCCAYATTEDLGEAPPTEEQIEIMAQVIATLCTELWLTIRPDIVYTHGEIADSDLYADKDKYGPQNDCERWDLQFLGTDESPEFTDDYNDPSTGGNVLRGKAVWYLAEWNRKATHL